MIKQIEELHVKYKDYWEENYTCTITELAMEMPECAELLHNMIDDAFKRKGAGAGTPSMNAGTVRR